MKRIFICHTCKKPFVDEKHEQRKYCSPECSKNGQSIPVEDRFEKYIIPEPNSGCWLWCGCWNQDGYGHIRSKGKIVSAHRISWELYVGPIPDGQGVLHKCDTPPCVNPSHLFLGKHIQNMHDRDKKGRGRDKLTEEQVKAIRRDNRSYLAIGSEYGICTSNVHLIKKRKSYTKFT